MDILSSLTDTVLRRQFDPVTLHRGLEYAVQGRVNRPAIEVRSAGSASARALVAGSRSAPYLVQLDAEMVGGEIWLDSSCTCPVQVDCKHGAALALALGRPAVERAPAPPSWQRQLTGLVSELDRGATVDAKPLALEVSLIAPRRHASSYERADRAPTICLRPLRRGARGGWVKTGADWRELVGAAARGTYATEHVDALLDLHGALQTTPGYWYPGTLAELAQFGSRVVTLLQRARTAGVTLVAAAPLTAVDLVCDPLVLTSDLTRGPDGGTRIRLGLEHADRLWYGADVVPVGHPATVVGLLADGVLTLATTERPLSGQSLSLLGKDAPIDVPAAADESLAEALAPLTRLVAMRSPDGSVPLPERVRPVLRLTVTWDSSTDAALDWSWRYGEQEVALVDRDSLSGLRDPAAERALLTTVPSGMTGRSRVRDGDALAFAVHDLPALRGLDDVDVVEVTPPVFRESEVAPTISFDLADGEDDGPTDWLDLEVTISVEGERVPLTEVLATLTREEDYVVLPSGLYLRADRPEFDRLREVVAAAAELREADGDRVSVGKHDLGVWAQLAELGIVDAQAAEWVRRAQALGDLTELPRPEPTGLSTTLRSYQLDGFHWLAFLWQHQLGGILADDMGLGKTLQVLALVQHAVSDDHAGPFLVVAPTSVVTAWASEAAQHAPGLRLRTITRRSEDVAAAASEADIVVTTYALLRLEQDAFAATPWSGLVLDEAQQVKNHQSKTYVAARRIEAPFRLAVTGTPFENRLMELWSLLSITVPGIYPWPRTFVSQVVTPVEKGHDQLALARFRRRIRPFMLRRTKEVVAADLPAKQEQLLEVDLNPKHRKIYDTHLAKERQRILGLVDDFERNRVAIFSALTTLRRLALDPALIDATHDRIGSAKLDVLVEHLSEITAEGHRALVFSQFTSYLERVERRLDEAGIETTYLDGRTRDRAAAIARFRAGSAEVFLISLKAGGVGLTLTEADYVFVLDPWWNPAAEAQAVDRAHRIGQTRPVHVYRMIATDTIEEKVVELKDRKAKLFAQVIDGDGTSAGDITAADIRDLFGA